MTTKKKQAFNYKLKALFEQKKKEAKVTSIQVAETLNVSVQTITNMSGRLDSMKVSDFFNMCELMQIPAGQFMYEVMSLSEALTEAYARAKKD